MFDTCTFKPEPYWLTFKPEEAHGRAISESLENLADTAEHRCLNPSMRFKFPGFSTECGRAKDEQSDREVVTFRRVNEALVTFSLKPFSTPFKTNAVIFHSNILYRDPATNRWLESSHPEHSRLMKVRPYSKKLTSEIKFLLLQQGSLGFGYVNRHIYLDMTRCTGDNLYQWLQENKLICNRKMKLTHSLLTQLCTYVSANLIHPDLKPSNILYDAANNAITFIDFNCIRDNFETLPDNPADRMTTYTRSYGAPEQVTANKTSLQSMVYTMGIILTNLWSDCPSATTVAYTDLTPPFEPVVNYGRCFHTLRSCAPLMVRDLKNLLKKMVRFEPMRRPSSHQALEEFESILQEWQNYQGATQDV